MESYNAPKDEGYQVKNNYSNSDSPVPIMQSSSYSINQSGLKIYKEKNEQQKKKISRCPKGALLGEIGMCCGMQCTRACALEA